MAGIANLFALIDRLKRNAAKNIKDPIGTLEAGVLALDEDFKQDPVNTIIGSANIGGGLLGMTKLVKAPKAPQADALEAARRNAVEMLGLPENNTAMDRAKAMGFVDAYHGTADDIKQIDPRMYGASTGAQSAKKAFFGVNDPRTAAGYADYAATDSKVKRLLDLSDKAEKRGNWDEYDRLVQQSEELDSLYRQEPRQGQNVMPLMIRANRGVSGAEMDAKGAEFVDLEGGVNRFLNQAIAQNKDLAVIKNLADDVGFNGRPATHYAALNPSVIRSRFAAFDPARVNENNLLASRLLPLALPGLLFAGDEEE